jgi:adenosylhomocysteine nucleosidase
MTLVIKTGMTQEFKVAKRFAAPDVMLLSGVMTVADLDVHIPADCKAILSFGLNGGLGSYIQVGELTIARELATPEGKVLKPDDQWGARLASTMRDYIKVVRYYSSGEFNTADTPSERAQLYIKYQAEVVDDETYAVAEFAAKRGIPWQALRSCSDDANDTIPPAARNALNSDGTDNLIRVLTSICRNPLQVPAMLKIAHNFGKSLNSLKFAAAHSGANFQWV